jgi:hypothetical protein
MKLQVFCLFLLMQVGKIRMILTDAILLFLSGWDLDLNLEQFYNLEHHAQASNPRQSVETWNTRLKSS